MDVDTWVKDFHTLRNEMCRHFKNHPKTAIDPDLWFRPTALKGKVVLPAFTIFATDKNGRSEEYHTQKINEMITNVAQGLSPSGAVIKEERIATGQVDNFSYIALNRMMQYIGLPCKGSGEYKVEPLNLPPLYPHGEKYYNDKKKKVELDPSLQPNSPFVMVKLPQVFYRGLSLAELV